MPNHNILHVAEKNSVAKSITPILSRGNFRTKPGYEKYCPLYCFESNFRGRNRKHVVTSVMGHLMSTDFTDEYRSWNSCTPEQLFTAPIVEFVPDKFKNLERQLKSEARNCDTVVLWLDCDREGEAIANEVVNVCRNAARRNLNILRAHFSAVNATEVNRAMSNLRSLNENVVNAVKARQEIDLRLGALFTRWQTKLLQQTYTLNVVSYGPCQFPTLGFVVDRFTRIENFEQETFWKIKCEYGDSDDKQDGLNFCEFSWKRAHPGLFNRACATMLLETCVENPVARVVKVLKNSTRKFKPMPLATTALGMSMSRWRRITAKRALDAAEKLYQKGYISYPRTETEVFRPEFDFQAILQEQTQSNTWGNYATELLQPQNFVRPRAGNGDDKAHPPIHPVKFVDVNSLESRDEKEVYEFVVRHFLACCSKDALGNKTVVDIKIADEYFSAQGLQILERNYLNIYMYDRWNGKKVPSFEEGHEFEPSALELKDGKTNPPPLLKEHDLMRMMESAGIGTDATIAQHIETIKTREYVTEQQDQALKPTAVGIGLVRAYQTLEMDFDKPSLRAQMEADCKQIEAGRKNKDNVILACMTAMRGRFSSLKNKTLEWQAKFDEFVDGEVARKSENATVIQRNFMKCVNCGGNTKFDLMRLSDNNNRNNDNRFLLCKKCKKNYPIPRKGQLEPLRNRTCPLCNNIVIKIITDRGTSYHVCPSCYNVPPGRTGKSGTSNMNCFSCQFGECPLASGQQIIVQEKCRSCNNEPMVLKSRAVTDGERGSMKYRIMCKSKNCKNENIYFPDSAVKKIVLPSDINSRRECSRCGMQKLLITLKYSSVPPGTNLEMLRCPRCDKTLRDLKGDRGGGNGGGGGGSSSRRRRSTTTTTTTTTNNNRNGRSGQAHIQMQYNNNNISRNNNNNNNNSNNYSNSNYSYNDNHNNNNNNNSYNNNRGNYNGQQQLSQQQQRGPKKARSRPPSSNLTCKCNCGKPAVKFTSRSEKNPNREFFKCVDAKNGGCDFFKWVDEVENNNGGSNYDGQQQRRPKKSRGRPPSSAKICYCTNCGKPASKFTSRSEKNPNREFFSCKAQENCNFFQWVDEM